MTQPLSEALRTETSAAHEDAEGSAFVTALLDGSACRPAFVALAVQLFEIYQALEETLWTHYSEHPMLTPVLDHRLDRVTALVADLTHLVGPDFEARIASGELPICPTTSEYVRLLRHDHTPESVLAHHYVRYLGDLSGGQIIARLVQRHYGIDPQGLGFYHFDGIEKPKAYKDSYRAALDSIELDDASRARVIAAAVASFELNRRIFADLGAVREPAHAAAGSTG